MSDAPLRDGAEYIQSLRGRGLSVYLNGERVPEPVDHPMIRPSINAVAATYDLALSHPGLGTAESPLIRQRVNRFLHVAGGAEDLVLQNQMQRRLGQLTGTCFQRCVGMDAINALWSLTFDLDRARGTTYHERLRAFVAEAQRGNRVVAGAMTDPKGDRSRGPAQQDDPDLYLRVVRRRPDGVFLRGAKVHQTGCINSHQILVMPTTRLREGDEDYAVVAAVPVTDPGLTFIYGRQASDLRALHGGPMDQGNARFSGQEAMILFDGVFVPNKRVFMNGEVDYAADLVERFTTYHRRSYVCKTGLGDVLIGAAAEAADRSGVADAGHVKDKLVEMAHLNETIYGAGVAASHQGSERPAGNWEPDPLLANVCKHNVTRLPFEIARLAQDLAGGLVGTMPSEADLRGAVTGPWLRKYLRGRGGDVEGRLRIIRLIENLTLGRNAVGYLTESLHGAGSPQAQRILIRRMMKLASKRAMARRLAGVEE